MTLVLTTAGTVLRECYLDVQMNPELCAWEPLGWVAVEADDMLPGGVRRERELALAAVHLHKNNL